MRVFSLPVLIGSLLLISACTGAIPSQETKTVPGPEAVAVTEAATTLLAALSAPDTATLAQLLTPDAMIYSVRAGEGGPTVRAVSRAAFLESLGNEDQELLERMWSPKVEVDGDVAMVWTPYDFHLNGEFSHCGTDIFTMLKGPEGWQVASITFNVVREGCSPSPLGSPDRSGK
jgi:hypothetical protein